jgi:hypothetical protein
MTCPGEEAGFRPAGVCGFPVDAALDAAAAPIYWRPEIAPAVVVRLAPAPPDSPYAFSLVGFDAEHRTAEDGLHMRLALGPQLLLPAGVDLTAPMAVVLSLDDRFAVRSAAARRFFVTLNNGAPPMQRLSAVRRLRLKRMLRALDGRESGASYRDIAEHILGVRIADSAGWRVSSARDVAMRLCRAGGRLAQSGYLALLRRHP